MSCATVRGMFLAYLTRQLPPAHAARIRHHLDHCGQCWTAWDRLRWDRAADTPLYTELAEYLGDRFTPYLDSSHALAQAWDHAAPHTAEQVRRFYRTTDAYLYNQVIWHASGNRPHYIEAALPLLAAEPGATILDYGCGIGEDILALHRAGFHVIGCDLPSPPTDFLAWRATRHHYPHPVYQPDQLPHLPPPTILWTIDALDHIPDLDAALGDLLSHVDLVICEDLLTIRKHGQQGFHHRRPRPDIEQWLARYGLARAPAHATPAGLTVARRSWRR